MKGDRRAVAVLAAVLIAAVILPVMRNDSYFFRDDFKNQYLPGYAESVRAWQAGEPALLTALSWRSSALAGEYQYAVFSPVLAVCNLALFNSGLPPHLIAAALVGIHLLILGCGCYVLARSKGLTPPLATMVALASSLNGWVFYWGVNWFPMLSSFAYLPWVWWLLERSLALAPQRSDDGHQNGRRNGRRETIAAGLLIALIFTAGWPFTCLMIGLITGYLGLRRVYAERNLQGLLPLVIAVAIGLGISAPAWLMLVEYSGSTLRGQTTSPLTLQHQLVVPIKAYLAMVLPTMKAAWYERWLPIPDMRFMHVGLAPVMLWIAAMIALRGALVRQLKWDLLWLISLFCLASLPSIGMFKWSFRWLPLLFLQLALFAGRAAMLATRQAPDRFRPGLAAPLAVAAVAGIALGIDGNFSTENARLIASLMAIALAWMVIEHVRVFARWRWHLPWVVICATSVATFVVTLKDYQPVHKIAGADQAPVFDPSITYLALYDVEQHYDPKHIVAFAGQLYFPGNEHMHSGLRFVNGYSPMGPAGSNQLFGFDYMGSVPQHGGPEARQRQLGAVLRRMAVDGLVVWPGMEASRNVSIEDFEQVAVLPEARVLHRRAGPTPRIQTIRRALVTAPVEKVWLLPRPPTSALAVLEKPGLVPAEEGISELGEADLTVVEDSRHRVEVMVDASTAERPVVVSFGRPWFPGYRVTLDGEPTALARLDGLIPAVEVPAGLQARVALTYRPRSLVLGLMICGLTAMTLCVVGILTR